MSHKVWKFIAKYSVNITDITGMEDANILFNEQASISKQYETKVCFFTFIFLVTFLHSLPQNFSQRST